MEEEEEDEDEKVLNEMEQLTHGVERKKKREKKILAKRQAKVCNLFEYCIREILPILYFIRPFVCLTFYFDFSILLCHFEFTPYYKLLYETTTPFKQKLKKHQIANWANKRDGRIVVLLSPPDLKV